MRRKLKLLFSVLAVCMLAGFMQSAQAAIVFQDLGTGAPPATLGVYAVAPFDQVAQAAIPNGTAVTTIPGSPIAGDLTVSTVTKQTIGAGWATWSHGYTGVVYTNFSANAVTLTLPTGAGAFYFYAEPNSFSAMTINATAADGTTSGDISVIGNSGANGFAFYATGTTSTITSITVTSSDATGFAVGEFGIAVQGVPGLGNSFVFPPFPAICGVPGASSICVVE